MQNVNEIVAADDATITFPKHLPPSVTFVHKSDTDFLTTTCAVPGTPRTPRIPPGSLGFTSPESQP